MIYDPEVKKDYIVKLAISLIAIIILFIHLIKINI